MATAAHKAIVRRYVEEALDHMNVALLDDIVPTDCIIHRPGLPEPLRGLVAFKQFFASILQVYSNSRSWLENPIRPMSAVSRWSI
jgi:hypothetical protein